MAQLIPTFSTIDKNSHTTTGERRLARRLESLLDDTCTCWYDIPVGSNRRYPDFIVLNPNRGVLFLEVKDWKISSLKKITPTTIALQTNKDIKHCSNPLEQVRQCAYAVVNKLKQDIHLQQKGMHLGKLCFPYGYGVVLPFITRKQLNEALAENVDVLQPHLVICSDEMTENTDASQFSSRLWEMFHYQFGDGLSEEQVDRIRWHLYPEIRITSQQEDLFEEESSYCYPDIVKIMDMQQEQLARSLGEGHRVIHGVAGSGKTLILGFRSQYLAESLTKPILITCYNITLAARLRAFFAEKNLSEKVHVFSFHAWCYDLLRRNNLIKPSYGASTSFDDLPRLVLEHLEQDTLASGQYGAILIDEGHDLEADWFKILIKMLDPDTASLLLLYDDAQSIYKKKSSLNFSLASVGVQAQGRTTVLKLNYRNTREILEYAYKFAHKYFEDLPDTEIPIIKPESAGINGSKPVLKKFDTLSDEVKTISHYILKWLEKGHSLKDIAVLYPDFKAGKAMHNQLLASGIEHLWCAKPVYKKQYSPLNDKVTLIPFQSSKGLEFPTVITINSSFMKEESTNEELIKLLYVAFTRATKNLLVTYNEENEVAKALVDSQ
ncbi:3'-5' exonuclease [Vibrio harveyi]|uniref:3'-5' exonuclease n=1 Tax=Vibrio harveyi TaxID=669 RepID=UPI0003453ED2|nr:nuclease-related domain-containing DEAD/DEAH box helicase [Vibrio harveyi]